MQVYSQSELKEMYGLYLRGCTLQGISERFGIPLTTLAGRFKKAKYPLRSKIELHCQYFDGIKFTIRQDGYYARTDGKREKMHRYIWERMFGRIPKGCDVHHINGDKTDNRIKNLECISKSDHARLYNSGSNQYQKQERRNTLV